MTTVPTNNSNKLNQDEAAAAAAPISSPEHSSSSSSSLSSSSEPTLSSTGDSQSSADTILDRDRDIQSKLAELDLESGECRKGAYVHGHILPAGWTCTYDADIDQYMFEYKGDIREPLKKLDGYESSSSATRKKISSIDAIDSSVKRHSTKDEAVLVKTPTADHDVQTSRRPTLHRFECQHGYHFPTSPTPSMLSDLAKQVAKKDSGATPAAKTKQIGFGRYKLTMLTEDAEQAKRLREMFPTATGPIVDQMIRIFHGREGIIKAALISQGYKRAVDYNVQQEATLSPIMLMMTKPENKKLFEKLIGYFPGTDEAFIKSLMYKHKGVEYEIISAIVESGQLARKKDDKSSKTRSEGYSKFHHEQDYEAIMKLRYLKSFFPTCDESKIYHLLYRCSLDLQKVKEELEKEGYTRANLDEVLKIRNEQTKQMRAKQTASAIAKEPSPNQVETHRNRPKPTITESRINNLKESLRKNLPEQDEGLLLSALEATDYNEALAKKFIQEMDPIDEARYKERYEFHLEQQPDVVMYPCKGNQVGGMSLMSAISDDYLAIPREVVECENALALLKVDACTFTRDDFAEPRFTHAQGKRLNLALGSIFKGLEVKESLRKGASEVLRLGSNYQQMSAEKRLSEPKRALGRDKQLAQGRRVDLRSGPNLKLIQRTHPFFRESFESNSSIRLQPL